MIPLPACGRTCAVTVRVPPPHAHRGSHCCDKTIGGHEAPVCISPRSTPRWRRCGGRTSTGWPTTRKGSWASPDPMATRAGARSGSYYAGPRGSDPGSWTTASPRSSVGSPSTTGCPRHRCLERAAHDPHRGVHDGQTVRRRASASQCYDPPYDVGAARPHYRHSDGAMKCRCRRPPGLSSPCVRPATIIRPRRRR